MHFVISFLLLVLNSGIVRCAEEDTFAVTSTTSRDMYKIFCDSTEWIGDEKIAWNISINNWMYAANRHCLDEHNMYVLCMDMQGELMRDKECKTVQSKISFCPEGFEENERWCYKILKSVTYHEPCPYHLVDYVDPKEFTSEPAWINVERISDYGIGYFINVSLKSYGNPVKIPYERNSATKNCSIYNRGKLRAVSCDEKFSRVCAYLKTSDYLLCGTRDCINYEFYEDHTRCICANETCEKYAELSHPYQNFVIQNSGKKHCKLDLIREDGVVKWKDSGNEIADGYWTYETEYLDLDVENYVLGLWGWSMFALDAECAICEQVLEVDDADINFFVEDTLVTVFFNNSEHLREMNCFTDAFPDILMMPFSPDIGNFKVLHSGFYWCEAFDMVRFRRISSEKLLMVVDYIYPIEIVLIFGDHTDPTMDVFIQSQFKLIKWIKTLRIDGNLVRYLLHVVVPNNTISLEYMDLFHNLRTRVRKDLEMVKNSTYVSDLYNQECCLEIWEYYEDITVTWITTKIHTSVFPDVMCLTGNKFLPRKCIWDYHLGARWEQTEPCVVVKKKSPHTDELEEIFNSNITTEEAISDLETITSHSLTFVAVDIHLIAAISEKLQPKQVDLAKFTNIMSNVIDAEKVSLAESQSEYNATDNLLGVYDTFLSNHQLDNRNKTITSENLLVYIFNSKNENSGVALIKLSEGVAIRYIKRGTSLLELAEIFNLEAAVYIPEDLIKCVGDQPITITIHFTNALFNELEDAHQMLAKNIAVLLPKVCNEAYAIPMLFNPNHQIYKNMSCGYWKYGDGIKGRWVEENPPEIISSKIYSCNYPHVTHFGLFISNNRLSRYSNLLDIVSTVESILSSMGLTVIIITGLFFRAWREKSKNQLILHYSIISLIQILILFIADNTNIYDPMICSLTGAILHYTVLFQFNLMFIFAVQLYNKHVMVYEAHFYCMKLNLVSNYTIPLVPVIGFTAIFPDSYQKSEIHFCYPNGLGFIIFGLVPIGVVLAVNLIIYAAIFWEFFLKTKGKECTSEMKMKLVLIIVSFFLLGLTWIFGLLAEVFQNYTLLFIFSTLASIQGFVIFVFIILNDKGLRVLYKRSLKKCYYNL